jgi:hypothetical protein
MLEIAGIGRIRQSAREATAYHEAGHMVAAWRLGMKIRSATIVPDESYSGKVEHDNPLRGNNLEFDNSDRARIRGENAVLICLAGPIAQRQFRPSSLRGYHGGFDHEKAVNLALTFNSGDELEATAYLK